MREIKFRCWYDKKMHKVVDIDFAYEKINLFGADIINFKDGELMQYTGLKDKNGKEIYEGDIIQILGGEYEQGFYEWNEKVQIKDLIYDGYNLMMTISQIGNKAIEIIGNIYDNPELLEV